MEKKEEGRVGKRTDNGVELSPPQKTKGSFALGIVKTSKLCNALCLAIFYCFIIKCKWDLSLLNDDAREETVVNEIHFPPPRVQK